MRLSVEDTGTGLIQEDKVDATRNVGNQRKFAMAGDCVNDAPAMAKATVSIAIGAA